MTWSPNRLIIRLHAIAHNLEQVRKLVGSKVKIMGVVKSDAYGHGLIPVSSLLVKNKVDCLGVAHVFEAVQLRQADFKLPIVVLCGISTPEESSLIIENKLSPVLFDYSSVQLLARQAQSVGQVVPIFLKVDTGMGRLGIPFHEVNPFVKKIMEFSSVKLEGLVSHLSSADEKSSQYTKLQIKRFRHAIEEIRSLGINVDLNSMANSAGLMRYRDAHFDMVRPGIMLYGGMPSPEFNAPVQLKPAMELASKVLQVRNLPDGSPVSYGRTYYTKGHKRIAVLSAGYGNGIPRNISNKGMVIIRGKKMPIVGRVCMNLTMCDVTDATEVVPGDDAVFLGRQADNAIGPDEMAKWAESISYEIFCSIGQQNKREYVE